MPSPDVTPTDPGKRAPRSRPELALAMWQALLASPFMSKASMICISIALAVVAGPAGISFFLGPQLDRWLEIRALEVVAAEALEAHAALPAHGRVEPRLDALEAEVASARTTLLELRTQAHSTDRMLYALCVGLSQRNSLNIDCRQP